MNKRWGFLIFILFLVFATAAHADVKEPAGPSDVLIVSGTISNTHGKGIKDAEVSFSVNGKKVESSSEVATSRAGQFKAEITLPRDTLPNARVELEVDKPCFKNSGPLVLDKVVKEQNAQDGNVYYLAHKNLKLERTTTPAFWIATLVLIAVYVLIAFEWMHRTLAAFLGAALLLTITYTAGTFNHDYSILSYEDAIHAIDMNVIFLLMAMMIIVGVLKKTGVFQWMAYKSYQTTRGNVFALAATLMFITAVVSAFLDNVTTMLLIIPITIEIAVTLKIDPVALLIPEAFASNIGGTATLIGDPPNIMIGSYAKLSFVDFVQNLTLVNVIALAVAIVYFIYWHKKDYLSAKVENVQELIERLREEYKITNKTLLTQAAVILAITILMFILHGALKMEPSIAALIGAAILMTISRIDIVEMLEREIEWPTLIFFIMLFIVVAAAEETGLIQIIADWVRDVSKGSLVIAVLVILWVSAIASAFIDNIPFTATMLPIVAYLTTAIPGAQNGILWWSLALGACLGGNGTMIGASANVVTVGMAERAGYNISFMHYMKTAFVPMLISVVICSFWLLLVEM